MAKAPQKDQKEVNDLEEEKKKHKMMAEKDDEDEDEDEDEDDDEDEDEEENGKKMKMKEGKYKKMKEDIDADINAIFSGEELSEEFKSNAKAIFEAAVLAKVSAQVKTLEEEYQQKLEEQVSEITENIVSKVDEYLEYVVNEWTEEHQLAIDSGIRSEIAEDFMVGLKNLFTEHYINVPEDKVDIIEELAAKVDELESELDKTITENANLSNEINDYKKTVILDEVSEGLTEVQFAKLQSLAENIEFISEEDYKEKVTLTKKKYFEESKKEETVVSKNDQFGPDESQLDEQFSPIMDHYVKNLSMIIRK
jgi:hypothetical protein